MPVWDPQGGNNIRFDKALTTISVGWPNEGMVAERLFPSVPVSRQSDKYYIFGKEAWGLDIGSDVRAPGTETSEIPGLTVSTDTYYAQEHALQISVTDEEREVAVSPFAPDRDATELVTAKLLLGREIAMHTMVTSTTNYESGYSTTLSGTSQWSDYVNSNPISDWKTGRNKIHSGAFLLPTVAVLPYQVMTQLEDHPDFIERIKYVQRGMLTQELIASLLQIPSVVVPGMGYNSANPGQAASVGYLWGKDALMAYVPDRPGWKIPAFAYEFTWNYPGGGSQPVDRWREERRKSDVIRVQRRYDLKLVALGANSKSIAGYLIKAAVA